MTDIHSKINVIIQAAAIDGTLTQSAIQQFQDLVKENDGLKDSIKESEHNLEMSVKTRDALGQERDDARTVRDQLLTERDGVVEREKAITTLELQASGSLQRVQDHKDMMTLIFKPGEIRRNAWGSVPGFDDNGYPNGQTGQSNEDSTEHDE